MVAVGTRRRKLELPTARDWRKRSRMNVVLPEPAGPERRRIGSSVAQGEGKAKNGSVGCGPNDEMEAGSVGERPEIPVSRKERNPAIHTALSDQGIAEARLAALGQHLRPQLACALPIAKPNLDERQFAELLRHLGRKLRVTRS